MLDPVPARPSQPRTQWFFALASFALRFANDLKIAVMLAHAIDLGLFEGGARLSAPDTLSARNAEEPRRYTAGLLRAP